MENDKLPIKFFAPREIDELRVEGMGNTEPPKWLLSGDELVYRSQQLHAAISPLAHLIKEREARQSAVPFVFVAKMCDDSTAKSRRKDIAALFQTSSSCNLIGLTDADELLVRVDSSAHMSEIESRIQDCERNSYAISCLETFFEFKPHVEGAEGLNAYKVKLIDFQDYETNIAMQRLFERQLTTHEISFHKTQYADNLPVYKLIDPSKAVLDSLSSGAYEMLFSIEPMPKYILELDASNCEGTLNLQKPEEGQRYETLGILDNGIAQIPQLTPWMMDKRWSVYPDSVISPTHGTFVAGVALYGDAMQGDGWVGHKGIMIHDAAVFPDTSKEGIDEDDLISNIREAVQAKHDVVKIWNLSISITREVVDYKFSDFAIALDDIQKKYNVLICKSAGNCENFVQHLPKGRIHEGADSVLSLVVGSVAHAKGIHDYAEINNPSPFTRVGPGPEYIIKPEVAHYGGNAGVNNAGVPTITGVKSFSMSGKIAENVGTSFSTPRVAALATGLFQELDEEFDPLLIKGLIIHSATYPKELTVPTAERTKQLGFGIPKSVSEIIYNDPYEATLILRDTLSKGEYIDIMDFPMPKSLVRNGVYTGQIIATLVYEPILDPTQGIEYCQSNIDLKFGTYAAKEARDMSRHHILNPIGRVGSKNLFLESLYSKRLMKDQDGEFALRERLLIQYGDKYYPVKKYAVDLSELTDANKQNYATADKNWYLTLRGLFRNHTEQKAMSDRFIPTQELCLILTIRDPARQARVYDEVTQGLDAYNFWHSNIKISSDVSVVV